MPGIQKEIKQEEEKKREEKKNSLKLKRMSDVAGYFCLEQSERKTIMFCLPGEQCAAAQLRWFHQQPKDARHESNAITRKERKKRKKKKHTSTWTCHYSPVPTWWWIATDSLLVNIQSARGSYRRTASASSPVCDLLCLLALSEGTGVINTAHRFITPETFGGINHLWDQNTLDRHERDSRNRGNES